MSLTVEQQEQVLEFPAFQSYTLEQKKELGNYLNQGSFALNFAQMDFLFGDGITGGFINDLIEAFPTEWEHQNDIRNQVFALHNIIFNIQDLSFYPNKSTIESLVGQLGSYNDVVAENVKHLVTTHVMRVNPEVLEQGVVDQFWESMKIYFIGNVILGREEFIKDLDLQDIFLNQDANSLLLVYRKLIIFMEGTQLPLEDVLRLSKSKINILFNNAETSGVLKKTAELIANLLQINKVTWDSILNLTDMSIERLIEFCGWAQPIYLYINETDITLENLLGVEDKSILTDLFFYCKLFKPLIVNEIILSSDLLSLRNDEVESLAHNAVEIGRGVSEADYVDAARAILFQAPRP